MTRARRSVVARLVVATVAAGVLAAFVGALLLRTSALRELRDQVLRRNEQEAAGLARTLDTRVNDALTTLRTIAATAPVATFAEGARHELQVMLRNAPQLRALTLFDDQGVAVAAASTRSVPDPAAIEPRPELVSALMAGGSHVEVDRTGPFPTLELAVPVEFPTGRLVGVLLTDVPLAEFSAPILRFEVESEGIAFVVDRAGNVIVHPERNRVVARERLRVVDLPGRGAEPGHDVSERDGEAVLLAAAPAERLPGVVVVEQPQRDAVAALTSSAQRLVVILIAVVAAIVLTVSIAGQLLLRPLRPLAVAVQRLGRGEQREPVPVQRNDEIGALAAEFNRMATALDEHVAELTRSNAALATAKAELEERLEQIEHARTELALSEERFASGFERAPIGMALVDVDGRFQQVNRALCQMLGLEEDELLDSDLQKLPDPRDREQHLTQVRALTRGAADAVRFESRYVRGDGATVWCLVSGAVVAGRDRQPRYLYLQFLDITEHKHIEEATSAALEREREAVEQLRDLDEMKNAFLRAVSHELRTPLALVLGVADALREGQGAYDVDDYQQLVEQLHSSARRLASLFEDLLDLDRLQRERLEPRLESVDVGQLVARAVSDLFVDGHDRVRLDVEHVHASVEPSKVERIVVNLVGNALRYAPGKTPVDVRVRRDGDEVEIAVLDRGPGVPDALKVAVFEPFRRGPVPPHVSGTGIGLSLVARFAELHGGRVEVGDREGGGAVFVVRLPVALRETAPTTPRHGT